LEIWASGANAGPLLSGGKTLAPGANVVAITATNSAGLVTTSRTLRFRIVR
jgi:hypothetical protein